MISCAGDPISWGKPGKRGRNCIILMLYVVWWSYSRSHRSMLPTGSNMSTIMNYKEQFH